jgi:hypothetical protein
MVSGSQAATSFHARWAAVGLLGPPPAAEAASPLAHGRYFKRIEVPELELLHLPAEQHLLTWTHAHNTLIIAYTKPEELLEAVRYPTCPAQRPPVPLLAPL